MCICINCRHVYNCNTYKLIQKQHKQYISENFIIFFPITTLIQININNSLYSTKFDWDLTECLSFVEKPGSWMNVSIYTKANIPTRKI